jgi:hypothetical protein
MSCQFCGKQFILTVATIYVDTKKSIVPYVHKKETCLGYDSQETDFQDDVSTTSTHVSEISMTTDNESETEEEMDPWIPLIEEAKQRSHIAFEDMKEIKPYKQWSR